MKKFVVVVVATAWTFKVIQTKNINYLIGRIFLSNHNHMTQFFQSPNFFPPTILFSVCKIFYNSNCLHNLSRFFLSNHTVHKTRFVVFDELNFYIKTCFLLFFLSNNSSLGVAWIFSRIFWLNQHFALACCCYTILCATLH